MTGAEKLEIWQKTIAFAETVYALTTGYPAERRQRIRRRVVSISSSIAEGAACGSRREFARFVEIASAALPDVVCQIEAGRGLGFLPDEQFEALCMMAWEQGRMLGGLHRSLPPESDG
ncbi:four helix bundle protein [Luteolibacter sp. LG18]|uniref:four helix bundle protein n=1 Tax=Luteolibacter sp. LG18 TaxID=2819286 RepID=UPI002B291D3E|nr:hypothetical protein llg_08340 [Luteolibacter sp. LG18]